jgi:hypothetical protein
MKKILHTIAFIFTLFSINSVHAQSVTWDVLKDDPYDIKNFSFAIDPLFSEISGQNGYSFGWGIRAEYMMGKRLQAGFDMRTAFGTQGYRISNDNTRNFFYTEANVGIILINKLRRRNVPIILSQSTSGNVRTTVSIKGGVPANIRRVTSFRGGIYQMTNSLSYKYLNDSLTTFSGGSSDFKLKDSISNSHFANQYGGFASTAVFGGFNFRRIAQLSIDVDGYGIRNYIRYSDFYIDGIFSPIVLIKDFSTPSGDSYKVKYDNISYIGWRVGWAWRKPKDQGFSAKFEFGNRPGPKAPVKDAKAAVPVNFNNFYATLTFGLYIPLKIKPVYEGED